MKFVRIKGKAMVPTDDSQIYMVYPIEVPGDLYPSKDIKKGLYFNIIDPEKLTESDSNALWAATDIHLVFEKEFFYFHKTKGVCMAKFVSMTGKDEQTASLGMSYNFESCTCGEIE